MISGEAQAGLAGFAPGGSANAIREDDGAAAPARHDATAEVGGRLAQTGARLPERGGRKMTDAVFSRLASLFAASARRHGQGAAIDGFGRIRFATADPFATARALAASFGGQGQRHASLTA